LKGVELETRERAKKKSESGVNHSMGRKGGPLGKRHNDFWEEKTRSKVYSRRKKRMKKSLEKAGRN